MKLAVTSCLASSIFTSTSMATTGLGLERVTRLDGLDSSPNSLNKAARKGKLADPKSRLRTLRVHAAPFALRGVIETDSNQDLPAGIPVELLKRFLLILSDRILDSRVDRAMPSLVAAPEGPKTRPALSRKAASIVSFS